MITEAFAGPLDGAGDAVIEADAEGLALGVVLGFIDGSALLLGFEDGFGVAAAVVGVATGD
jgi:hypothetical protein